MSLKTVTYHTTNQRATTNNVEFIDDNSQSEVYKGVQTESVDNTKPSISDNPNHT